VQLEVIDGDFTIAVFADLPQKVRFGTVASLVHQDEGFATYVFVILAAGAARTRRDRKGADARSMAPQARFRTIVIPKFNLVRNLIIIGMKRNIAARRPDRATVRV